MSEPTRELARGAINTPHLVFFVVAAAAPLTALGTNSPVAIAFGGPGAVGAFLLVGIILALFATGFTAMSLFVKNAGAFYAYIARGLGRPAGLGAAFLAVMSYNSIQIALYGTFAIFTQTTLNDFTGILVPWPVLALGGIVMVTVLGYRNIILSANILGIALAAECAILAIVAGAAVLNGGGPDGLTLAPLSPSNLLTEGTGAMIAFAFLSFIGFEATAIFSEEAIAPETTIPRATYIAIAFLSLFYAFIVWAVIDGFGLENAVAVAKKDPTGMYFLAALTFVGPWAKAAMEIFIVTSLFAVLLAFHNAVSRYQYALARESILPAAFSRTHAIHRSPWVSSLSQSCLAIVSIAPFWLSGADPFNDFYVPFTTPGIYGLLMLQILTAIAVAAFFAGNRRGLTRWRTSFAPLLGALGMSVMLYFAISNVELITGRTGAINILLSVLTVITFAIGFGFAIFLKHRRPAIYDRIGAGPAA